MQYRVTFDRIGRHHNVPALDLGASDADDMAFKLRKYARKYLVSRYFDVDVDLDAGKGMFLCGFQSGGTFSIEATS